MENSSKKIKCFCPRCQNTTNHSVLFSKEETGDDIYWWQSKYSVVECMGCEGIQFHKEDIDESDFEWNEYGPSEIQPRVSTYPHKKNIVNPISDTWRLPSSIKNLYVQTIDCLNRSYLQLAAAGFRAIIEAICKESGVGGKNLETMINNLAKAHIITDKDRDHLHAIRFMGNDSIHNVKVYREPEVSIVAHVVNAIVTSLYVISKEVEDLDILPVSKYEDFEELLEEYLSDRSIGDIDTLRGFIQKDRRVMTDDFSRLETELQTRISDGRFARLSMCDSSTTGHHPQQYKLES